MALQTVIDWAAITEREPEVNEPCLAVAAGFVLSGVVYWDGDWFYDRSHGEGRCCRHDVSHWCYVAGLKMEAARNCAPEGTKEDA